MGLGPMPEAKAALPAASVEALAEVKGSQANTAPGPTRNKS